MRRRSICSPSSRDWSALWVYARSHHWDWSAQEELMRELEQQYQEIQLSTVSPYESKKTNSVYGYNG